MYFDPCQSKIKANINVEIFKHLKHTDYKYFDDPKYYDEYTVSYSRYADKSIETFQTLSSSLSLIATVGSLVGYILSSTVYVLLITVFSVIIKVWVSKKVNKIQIQHEEESVPVSRKMGIIVKPFAVEMLRWTQRALVCMMFLSNITINPLKKALTSK